MIQKKKIKMAVALYLGIAAIIVIAIAAAAWGLSGPLVAWASVGEKGVGTVDRIVERGQNMYDKHLTTWENAAKKVYEDAKKIPQSVSDTAKKAGENVGKIVGGAIETGKDLITKVFDAMPWRSSTSAVPMGRNIAYRNPTFAKTLELKEWAAFTAPPIKAPGGGVSAGPKPLLGLNKPVALKKEAINLYPQ